MAVPKKPKGGRGLTAPYTTTHVRVPEPIADQCHELIARYRQYVNDGGDPDNPPRFLDQLPRVSQQQSFLIQPAEKQQHLLIPFAQRSLLDL